MDVEKQVAEAKARLGTMQANGLMPNVKDDFEEGELVNVSQRIARNVPGMLFWPDDEQQEAIDRFEEENSAIVYHAELTETSFGRLLSMFYVSRYEEEWPLDRRELEEMNPVVYVCNLDDPICSEFGAISFEYAFGGVVRTA